MKKRHAFRGRNNTPHYCKTHSGWSFFLRCLKNPSCEIDWSTETSRCSNCGALLKPPKALLAYCYLGRWWPGVLAFAIGVIVGKLQGLHYVGFILTGVIPCFLVTNLIPALLAITGTWSTLFEAGCTTEELLKNRRRAIQKRWNSGLYGTVMILIMIVVIVAILYMRAIAS